MIISCPRCGSKYKVDETMISPSGKKIRCSRCNGLFMVRPKPRAAVPPPVPGGVPAAGGETGERPPIVRIAGAPTILVAHESEAIRNMLLNILSRVHANIVEIKDGVEALMQIQNLRPQIAILDVALPKMFGFEVCEVVKREEDMKGMKVILLASAYDRTRLRRKPQNLFGADGYLEKHQIQDELFPLVETLLRPPAAPVPGEYAQAPSSVSQDVSGHGMAVPPGYPPLPELPPPTHEDEFSPAGVPRQEPAAGGQVYSEEEEKELEKARRLARIIVSDIALYNKDLVDEAVTKGQFYELLERDVTEGRELYIARVSGWIRERTNFLEEGFQGLIDSRKKELGLL